MRADSPLATCIDSIHAHRDVDLADGIILDLNIKRYGKVRYPKAEPVFN